MVKASQSTGRPRNNIKGFAQFIFLYVKHPTKNEHTISLSKPLYYTFVGLYLYSFLLDS